MSSQNSTVPLANSVASLRLRDAILSPRGLASIAVVQALVGLALAAYGLRFDGAIDLHRTWQGEAVPWTVALLDQVVAWPVAAVAAWGTLRLWRQSVGMLPVLSTVGAARIALVLVAPVILTTPAPRELTALTLGQLAPPSAAIVVAGFVALAGVTAHVTLLVLGLRRLTGVRGGRLAAMSVSVLAVAELVTRLVLSAAR